MSSADVERARHGYAAAARGDFHAILEMLAPDVRWHGGDPDAEGACRSRDQALAFMQAAVEAGRIGTLLDVIDAGDGKVVVVMQPPAPCGHAAPPRANVTTFRDGLVVEIVAFQSPEAALAAAGGASDPA